MVPNLQVEVGWFDAPVLAICNYQSTASGPYLLWALTDGKTFECWKDQNPPSVTASTSSTEVYDGYRVDDPSDNGQWNYYHNGTQFNSEPFPAFDYGMTITNGERHDQLTDLGHADFNGMQYENSGGWHDWTDPITVAENDSEYCNVFYSDKTHVSVDTC